MKFEEQFTLLEDQNPNGSYEKDVEGTFLVGDVVWEWDQDRSEYGYNEFDIRPCYHNGEKCWKKAWVWRPASGYCASGEGEEILTFEDGVKLLMDMGAYEWMFQKEDSE